MDISDLDTWPSDLVRFTADHVREILAKETSDLTKENERLEIELAKAKGLKDEN